MIKIIFSDIDGTLLNSDHVVTDRTRKALRQVVDKGVIFVPVSARMPAAIAPLLVDFLPRVPMISYNGALIQDAEGKVLLSRAFSGQEAHDFCRFLKKYFSELAWNVYSHSDWYAEDRGNSWIAREEQVVGLQSKELHLSDITELKEVHKLLIMGEPDLISQAEPVLKRAFPKLSIAQSLPYYLEVMAPGIQKGQAVAYFAREYGVDLTDTLAFGDNFNDLNMLREVGHPYVMGNAPQAIKDEIAQVTADNNHDGIAEVLESLWKD